MANLQWYTLRSKYGIKSPTAFPIEVPSVHCLLSFPSAILAVIAILTLLWLHIDSKNILKKLAMLWKDVRNHVS